MKRRIILLICLMTLLCARAIADVDIGTSFPDENFRRYVLENCDTDHNGKLDDGEIAGVISVTCNGLSIKSLKGIELFPNLAELYCYENGISELDLSGNAGLEVLFCMENELTSLDVSGNAALTWLYCYGNKLSTLDISGNAALEELSCNNNQLTSLNVSGNAALLKLDCAGNRLASLDLSGNTGLTELHCYDNRLNELDISENRDLERLYCYWNDLEMIDVSDCPGLFSCVLKKNRQKLSGAEVDFFGKDSEDSVFIVDHSVYIIAGEFISEPAEEPAPEPDPGPAEATVKGLKYKLNSKKKTATMTGTEDRNAAKVTVPATIRVNGRTYQVTEIANSALKACANLKELTIGKNIAKIGKNACCNCKKLKKITIKTPKLTEKNVGRNAFKNISRKAEFKCPKGLADAYRTILLKSGASKKSTIR